MDENEIESIESAETLPVAGESVEQVTHGEDRTAAATKKDADAPKTMLEAIEKDYASKQKLDAKDDKPAEKIAAKPDSKADSRADAKPDTKPAVTSKQEKPEDLFKMPEGLKEDGQKRFQHLIDTNKQISKEKQELQSAVKERDETLEGFRKTLAETGTSADDLDLFFGYKERIKQGDLNGAMQILQGQIKSLSLAIGKPVDHARTNPLSDFPDLSEDVSNLLLTEERAMEIARARKADADARARAEAQSRSQQGEQAKIQQRERAISSVEAWAANMAKQDIDYAAKEATILGKLKDIAAKYPPEVWLTRIQDEYDAIVKPAPATRDAQPLRRGGSGNPGAPAPKTMNEAIGAQLGWN